LREIWVFSGDYSVATENPMKTEGGSDAAMLVSGILFSTSRRPKPPFTTNPAG